MKTRYIPASIMLTAGVVVCIISLVNSYSAVKTMEILLATLIIFYMIGLIAKKLYTNIIENFNQEENEKELEEELEDQDLSEEETEKEDETATKK